MAKSFDDAAPLGRLLTMTSEDKVRACLAKFRTGPIVGLVQEHPIGYQIDADYCSSITKELQKIGCKWETRRATPTLWRQIPNSSGVYLFLFESTLVLSTAQSSAFSPKLVLYVGRAGDDLSRRTLRERYKSEYSKYIGADIEGLWGKEEVRTRAERLARFLRIYPLQYWYCIIEDRSKIAEIESSLIKLLNPPLNIVGRAKLKLSAPIPAFRSPK